MRTEVVTTSRNEGGINMRKQVYKDMVAVMSARGVAFGGLDIPEFYQVVEELFTP